MPLNESVFSDATAAIAPTQELDLTNGYIDTSVLPDTAVGAATNAAVILDEPVSSLAALLTSQTVLVGSEEDETLVGTSASEVFDGQSGNDVLTGMGGRISSSSRLIVGPIPLPTLEAWAAVAMAIQPCCQKPIFCNLKGTV